MTAPALPSATASSGKTPNLAKSLRDLAIIYDYTDRPLLRRAAERIEELEKERDSALEYGHKHRLEAALAKRDTPSSERLTGEDALTVLKSVMQHWAEFGPGGMDECIHHAWKRVYGDQPAPQEGANSMAGPAANGEPAARPSTAPLKPYQHPGEADLAPSVQECLRVELQSLGEIPDRTSPDDFPEGYVLTRHEIVTSILAVVAADRAARPTTAASGPVVPQMPRMSKAYQDALAAVGALPDGASTLQIIRAVLNPIFTTGEQIECELRSTARDSTDAIIAAVRQAWIDMRMRELIREANMRIEQARIHAETQWDDYMNGQRALVSAIEDTAK